MRLHLIDLLLLLLMLVGLEMLLRRVLLLGLRVDNLLLGGVILEGRLLNT